MATKQVVESECDRCHATVSEDLDTLAKRNRPSDPFVLPKGWLHVEGNTATSLVFEMDLCEVCKVAVLEAAGAARRMVLVKGS